MNAQWLRISVFQQPRQTLLFLIVSIALVQFACQALLPGSKPTPTSTYTPTNTLTPTSTLTPSPTFTSTFTPTPTLTPTLTPTPLPEPIGSDNAERLGLSNRYGDGRVIQISYSPDNRKFLLLTTVHLMMFDSNSGELLWQVETGSTQLYATITPDSKSVVTVTNGGSVQFWDASTGVKEEHNIPARENIIQATISQDGKYLLTLDIDRHIGLYELPSGTAIHEDIPPISSLFDVLNVTLSRTGDLFMVHSRRGYDWFLHAWDANTGEFSHALEKFPQWYLYAGPQAFSQDGGRFGAVTLDDPDYKTLKSMFVVWDASRGKKVNEFEFDQVVTSFALPSNGETALVGFEDGTIRHYYIGSWKEVGEYAGHQQAIAAIDISTDGSNFVSVDYSGVIKIWNLSERVETQTVQIELSRATGPFAYRYNVEGPYYYQVFPDYAMAYDPYRDLAAIFAPDLESINLVDLATGEVVKNLISSTGASYYLSPAFSEDGKTIGAAMDNGDIVLWDVESGNQILQFSTDHKKSIYRIGFTPDSRRIATLGHEQIFVWDTSTGEKVSNMYGYFCFDISPDGAMVASDNIDLGLYVWETETGTRQALVPAEYIFDLAYSPGGSTIAVAGFQIRKDRQSNVNLVYFVDAENEYQRLPIELTEHRNRPATLAFSPDGNILVSADFRGNIYLWDVSSGKLLKVLDEVALYPLKLGFSTDQTTLVVVSSDGTIRKYQVRP